jgi:hypothetical protein
MHSLACGAAKKPTASNPIDAGGVLNYPNENKIAKPPKATEGYGAANAIKPTPPFFLWITNLG